MKCHWFDVQQECWETSRTSYINKDVDFVDPPHIIETNAVIKNHDCVLSLA